ncbi:MAG: CHASE3 domain-containing protein [Aquabacterium sp.]|nr:CHASE3 domain-containing protein [Aquabacterium sp.]
MDLRNRLWIHRLRSGALALSLAVLLAGLLVAISELGHQRAMRQLGELVLMGQSRLELARLVRRVADAESSQRGYLLTARPEYLAPYQDARADVQRGLARLADLLAQRSDDADVQDHTADLRILTSHVGTKLSEMHEVLGMFALGRREAAQELLLTGIGRDEMVSIRTVSDRMLARENARVAAGLQLVFESLARNRVGITLVTLLSLLLVALVLRQRRQAEQLRQAQLQAIGAERDRLEVEVQHRTAELTNLARHLETAREDERARLARDLHDELGALLTAAKLDVARLRPGLQQSAPALLPRVEHLVQTLNSGIALKRRIVEDLRPSSLDNLGLLPALEVLCSEFADRLQVRLHTALAPVAMSRSAELTAFRLVQEALNNIAKHAQAASVTVTVAQAQQGGMAAIRVTDDGAGFDLARVALGSHGLVGMRYRVQAEGGQLSIVAAPGAGTQVQALLPLLAPAPSPAPLQA